MKGKKLLEIYQYWVKRVCRGCDEHYDYFSTPLDLNTSDENFINPGHNASNIIQFFNSYVASLISRHLVIRDDDFKYIEVITRGGIS
jgi:hypothetical protein